MGPEPSNSSLTDDLENGNQNQNEIPNSIQGSQKLEDPENGGTGSNSEESSSDDPEYLFQLIRDRRTLQSLPNLFLHLDRLLDDEITRVHNSVLYLGTNSEPLILPEPQGPVITMTEKLPVPTKDFPDFNFVGRLLGPRGLTAKQLEIDTGCRILVRGRGSLRDKKREEQMKTKSKWEHLNEELHVLISVEDTRNRAVVKMNKAIQEVKKLLVPSDEGEDELKKRQLLELALLNGTYKGVNNHQFIGCPPLLSPTGLPTHFNPTLGGIGLGLPGSDAGMVAVPMLIRAPDPNGAPIILPHPVPILSPPSLTPLSSPIGPPPGALFSPTVGEQSGILFHLEPCLMSPTSPLPSPQIEAPHNKLPPLSLPPPGQPLPHHQPFSFPLEHQQQPPFLFQHHQHAISRSSHTAAGQQIGYDSLFGPVPGVQGQVPGVKAGPLYFPQQR